MPEGTTNGTPHSATGRDREPPRDELGGRKTQDVDARPDTEQAGTTHQSSDRSESFDAIINTLRLIVLSFSALFAMVVGLFAFFGWRTVSDIRSTVESTVEQRVGELVSATGGTARGLSQEVTALLEEFDGINAQVQQLKGGVEIASRTLQLTLQGQTDPVGDYERLRSKLEQDEKIILDAETRKRAEIIFRKLLGTSDPHDAGTDETGQAGFIRPHVLAEVLYNAAGTASQLGMARLASELAKAANEGRNTPEHQARMFRAMIQAEELTPEEGEEKVFSLIDSLDATSLYSLHFVLSEAFNVAYASGRLRELVEVLKKLETRLGDSAPSYVSLLQAKIGLFLGSQDDVAQSIVALRHGLERASLESPNAWWIAASLEDSNSVVGSLLQHPLYRDEALEISDDHRELLAMNSEADGQDPLGGFFGTPGDGDIARALREALGQFQNAPVVDPIALDLDGAFTISDDRPANGGGWHWFQFNPGETSTYLVMANSVGPQCDPLVAVRDSQADVLGYDDDSGVDLSALLALQLEADETYFVGVRSATEASVRGASVVIAAAEDR